MTVLLLWFAFYLAVVLVVGLYVWLSGRPPEAPARPPVAPVSGMASMPDPHAERGPDGALTAWEVVCRLPLAYEPWSVGERVEIAMRRAEMSAGVKPVPPYRPSSPSDR